jgi:hypothetical protein
VIDATSMVKDPEVIVATVSDSIPTFMATNDDGGTPPELNQKLTKPGENDAATEALAAEASLQKTMAVQYHNARYPSRLQSIRWY